LLKAFRFNIVFFLFSPLLEQPIENFDKFKMPRKHSFHDVNVPEVITVVILSLASIEMAFAAAGVCVLLRGEVEGIGDDQPRLLERKILFVK